MFLWPEITVIKIYNQLKVNGNNPNQNFGYLPALCPTMPRSG
jgi:hypothetical protein